MSESINELLAELSEAPGVPGFEEPVRAILERRLSGLAEVSSDRLGSLIARKEGTAASPRIMFAGHMDEIGFMVTSITEEGFLRFQTLGGWWEQVMLAQRVVVYTRKGQLMGVIGSKPPHILSPEERKKVVEKKDMFIDIGAAGKEEAEALGVRPGDPVVPVCPYTPLANPKYVMGKAFDNRVGCALVVEVLRRLQEVPHPNAVYGVATVQEEVGLRGAATSTYAVEPDIAFALDTGIAGDTPGVAPHEAQEKLGKGPAILIYDASLVPHRRLRDFVLDVAEEAGIPVQFEAMPGGGTDAGRMHLFGRGVPSLAIAVPVRYIHSHAGVVHLDDIENTARLMVEVIRRLDAGRVKEITGA
ncbi:MAG: peptidase M28 [Firmicutes bacterium]|nr:peptidase M28 [Bacillota bacterium]MBO2520973.1 peptidase M28 [Bacillota bacterium]